MSEMTAGIWHPISTAPRDGSRVIVGNRHGVWEDYQVLPGKKSTDKMPIDGRQFQNTRHFGRPTHWMRLPKVPIEAKP